MRCLTVRTSLLLRDYLEHLYITLNLSLRSLVVKVDVEERVVDVGRSEELALLVVLVELNGAVLLYVEEHGVCLCARNDSERSLSAVAERCYGVLVEAEHGSVEIC